MASNATAIDPAWAEESNLGRILGVTALFHSLAVIFAALRLYVRLGIVKAPGVDDLFMVASVVSKHAPLSVRYRRVDPIP